MLYLALPLEHFLALKIIKQFFHNTFLIKEKYMNHLLKRPKLLIVLNILITIVMAIPLKNVRL